MPRGNGTGPMGEGPMTGRAAGYCTGNDVSGYANSAGGRGRGMRRGPGPGRGLGRGGFAAPLTAPPDQSVDVPTPSPAQLENDTRSANDIQALRILSENIIKSLETINGRITALESQPEDVVEE